MTVVSRSPRGPLAALARPFRGPGAVFRVAAGLALLGTVCSQHPNSAFSRVLRWDSFSAVFPNWRFFAPTPAQHDFQFHYRTLSHNGETSEWSAVEVIEGRRPHQIVWFPGRRPEKAVFDLGSETIQALDKGFARAVHAPSYRILRAYLTDEVERSGRRNVKGFQFALVRTAGYDESEEPEVVFVSPYTPIRQEASQA